MAMMCRTDSQRPKSCEGAKEPHCEGRGEIGTKEASVSAIKSLLGASKLFPAAETRFAKATASPRPASSSSGHLHFSESSSAL